MCAERSDVFAGGKKKKKRNEKNIFEITQSHIETHTEMRWMRAGKWLLIDALHPLFHYLQARLIILTFPTLSTPQSCFHMI